MNNQSTGFLIMLAGGVIALIGGLYYLGALSWFGRLPGDIRHESGNTRVYLPIVSMLLMSVVLSLAMWLIRKLF